MTSKAESKTIFDPYDQSLYGNAIQGPDDFFLLTPLVPSHHCSQLGQIRPTGTLLFPSNTQPILASTVDASASLDMNSHTAGTPSTFQSLFPVDLPPPFAATSAPPTSTPSSVPNPQSSNLSKIESEVQEFFREPVHSRTSTIQHAYNIFFYLDRDKQRGVIDIEQLRTALHLFSPTTKFSPLEVDHIFEVAASHNDGFLRFADFYSIFACIALIKGRFGTETTYLRKTEVHAALLEAGLDVNTKHLQHMFTPLSSETTGAQDEDQIDFPQLLQVYISAPRSEGDLFLFSWYKAGKTNFLLHKPHTEASPVQDFIAGTAAGVALTLIGHPFDTIKIRLQTGGFVNPIEAITQTVKREGPLAFYKGMSGPMLTIPVINAIVFAAYSQAQTLFRHYYNDDPKAELALWQIATAGMYAGLINCAVACPVELIKTRLQTQYGSKGSFRGPVDCIQHILKASGPKGLFRGMAATIYRELPGYGAQFYFYEATKRMWMKNGNRSETELTAAELLMSGGIAGLCGWIFSYPMDYIKSQIQAEPWNKKSRYKKHPLLFDGGFFSCGQATIQRHGWKELWKGFSVCAARGFPANAAGFLAYETTLAFMRENNICAAQPSSQPRAD